MTDDIGLLECLAALGDQRAFGTHLRFVARRGEDTDALPRQSAAVSQNSRRASLLSQRERNEVREKSWNARGLRTPPDFARLHPHPGPLPLGEGERHPASGGGRILKGFHPSAQGCDAGATLGTTRESGTTLKGLKPFCLLRRRLAETERIQFAAVVFLA